MTMFSDLREALVADLQVLGIPVHPSWPDVLTPPLAFITPPLSDTYVEAGPTFGMFTISVDLVLLVEHADANQALAELEALVQEALRNTADWSLSGVDAPAPTTVIEGGADYLASVIHMSKSVKMGV